MIPFDEKTGEMPSEEGEWGGQDREGLEGKMSMRINVLRSSVLSKGVGGD